jgi:hypothetical protein
MSNASRAIENYEALSTLTRELREAAARGEWDRLPDIQERRTRLVGTMAAIDSTEAIGEAARQRKNELIVGILADDAQTRDMVKAWMAQLEDELQNGRQELRLLREYRRHAG